MFCEYVLASIKICWKWTPPLTFPYILKQVTYLKKGSIFDASILKPVTWLSMEKDSTSKQDIRHHDQEFLFYYAARLLFFC